MNKYQFDRFVKSEVDSINYDGAEQAWEAFEANQADKTTVPPAVVSSRPKFSFSPLLAAASVAILIGVVLHQSMTSTEDVIDNTTFAVESTPTLDTDMQADTHEIVPITEKMVVVENIMTSPKPVEVQAPAVTELTKESVVTAVKRRTSTKQTFASSTTNSIVKNTPSTPVKFVTRVQNILPTTAHQAVAIAESNTTNRSIAPVQTSDLLPRLNPREIEQPVEFASVPTYIDIIENKKRISLFGEIGIGNKQAGTRLITGISIPMNSWSIETGAGVNFKGNRALFFKDNLESEVFNDFDEFHDYTFTQKVNVVLPVRIKKRIWKKHHIIAGVRGAFNLTNQVKVESIVPRATPQFGQPTTGIGVGGSEVDLSAENYRYTNITTASNSFSTVKSNRFNVDILAGYEYDLSRFSIGVSMAKPVFSSFKVLGADGSVRANIIENPSVNVSLKYRFI